jgi:hypothetical protein
MIPAAAGERIVAFARPGKPPGSPFYRWIALIPGGTEACGFSPHRNGF